MKKSFFALRALLATIVASVTALTFVSCGGADAQVTRTSAPQLKTQAPGFYRMDLGSFTVTAIYDGFVDIDAALLKNAAPELVQQLLLSLFERNPIQTAVNTYLIHTGERLILVDTGSAKKLGPTMGFLLENLRAAGYTPAEVDTVLLTHLHPDHVNGLINADGSPAFPNATVYVAKQDSDFWLDEAIEASAPADFKYVFEGAQAASLPYRLAGRWRMFNGSVSLADGVSAVPLPGHTPGHTGYMFESGGNRLLIWGDIAHNYATQLTNPDIGIEFDSDVAQAVATRKNILRRAADERLMVAGMHLPFPGIGYVRSIGGTGGYQWVPVEYGPVR